MVLCIQGHSAIQHKAINASSLLLLSTTSCTADAYHIFDKQKTTCTGDQEAAAAMSSARRGGRGRGRGGARNANPSDDESSHRRESRRVRFDTHAPASASTRIKGILKTSQKQNTSKLRGVHSNTENGRAVNGNGNGTQDRTTRPRTGNETSAYQLRYQTVCTPYLPTVLRSTLVTYS